MYYPILRGRQNELLALKELLNDSLLSDKIIPIIEPVKLSATLIKTIDSFHSSNHDFVIIRNPKVGSMKSDIKNPKNSTYYEKLKEMLKVSCIKRGLIIDSLTPITYAKWKQIDVSDTDIVTLCIEPDSIRYHEDAFHNNSAIRTIAPYAPAFRRIRSSRILLDDKFNKKTRNADYLENLDEFFSDDHLYAIDDGYIGFSDYSIIGAEYSESGFAPHAVAIHIVYFDTDKCLRVRHFVSEDNNDISDPAGKFYQALTQLVEWNKIQKLDTKAMKYFEKIYAEQSYPGLGVVKRLSLMHHLELISRYLDGEQI